MRRLASPTRPDRSPTRYSTAARRDEISSLVRSPQLPSKCVRQALQRPVSLGQTRRCQQFVLERYGSARVRKWNIRARGSTGRQWRLYNVSEVVQHSNTFPMKNRRRVASPRMAVFLCSCDGERPSSPILPAFCCDGETHRSISKYRFKDLDHFWSSARGQWIG